MSALVLVSCSGLSMYFPTILRSRKRLVLKCRYFKARDATWRCRGCNRCMVIYKVIYQYPKRYAPLFCGSMQSRGRPCSDSRGTASYYMSHERKVGMESAIHDHGFQPHSQTFPTHWPLAHCSLSAQSFPRGSWTHRPPSVILQHM